MDRCSRTVAIVLLLVGSILVKDIVPLLAGLSAAVSVPVFIVGDCREDSFFIALEIVQ